MNHRFPANCRLKNEQEIRAVFESRDKFRGKRLIFYRGPHFHATASDTKSELPSRFCFMVSRKCGMSVRRNRIKRVLRDIIRVNRYRIGPGSDYVIRPIPEALADRVKQEDFLADFKSYYGWN